MARRELRQPLHDEFKLGLNRGEIDVLGLASWHERMVPVPDSLAATEFHSFATKHGLFRRNRLTASRSSDMMPHHG
jgi:hypothetical protein